MLGNAHYRGELLSTDDRIPEPPPPQGKPAPPPDPTPAGPEPQIVRRGMAGWQIFLLCLLVFAVGRNANRPRDNEARNLRAENRKLEHAIRDLGGLSGSGRVLTAGRRVSDPSREWFAERLEDGSFPVVEPHPRWIAELNANRDGARETVRIRRWSWKRGDPRTLRLTLDLSPEVVKQLEWGHELTVQAVRGSRRFALPLELVQAPDDGAAVITREIRLPDDWNLIGTHIRVGHTEAVWPR